MYLVGFLLKIIKSKLFFQVAMEDICYEMKEDNGNLTFSNTDCEQHLPIICQKYNGLYSQLEIHVFVHVPVKFNHQVLNICKRTSNNH